MGVTSLPFDRRLWWPCRTSKYVNSFIALLSQFLLALTRICDCFILFCDIAEQGSFTSFISLMLHPMFWLFVALKQIKVHHKIPPSNPKVHRLLFSYVTWVRWPGAVWSLAKRDLSTDSLSQSLETLALSHSLDDPDQFQPFVQDIPSAQISLYIEGAAYLSWMWFTCDLPCLHFFDSTWFKFDFKFFALCSTLLRFKASMPGAIERLLKTSRR